MIGLPQDNLGSFSCHLCTYETDEPRNLFAHWAAHIDDACFSLALRYAKRVQPPKPRHLRIVK